MSIPRNSPTISIGEDLGAGELGGRSTLANAASFEPVVDEAEDADDEGAKIHESGDLLFASVGLVATERREVFSLVQALKETCIWG